MNKTCDVCGRANATRIQCEICENFVCGECHGKACDLGNGDVILPRARDRVCSPNCAKRYQSERREPIIKAQLLKENIEYRELRGLPDLHR